MLPRKLNHGDKISALYDLWNELIDYLAGQRIVPGTGVIVQRRSSGTILRSLRTGGGGGSGDGGGYSGPFAASIRAGDNGNILDVIGGNYIVNNTIYSCSSIHSIPASPGLACLMANTNSPNSLECVIWDSAELLAPPEGWVNTHALYPLAEIGEDYSIEQLCWGVPRFLFFGRCDE